MASSFFFFLRCKSLLRACIPFLKTDRLIITNIYRENNASRSFFSVDVPESGLTGLDWTGLNLCDPASVLRCTTFTTVAKLHSGLQVAKHLLCEDYPPAASGDNCNENNEPEQNCDNVVKWVKKTPWLVVFFFTPFSLLNVVCVPQAFLFSLERTVHFRSTHFQLKAVNFIHCKNTSSDLIFLIGPPA